MHMSWTDGVALISAMRARRTLTKDFLPRAIKMLSYSTQGRVVYLITQPNLVYDTCTVYSQSIALGHEKTSIFPKGGDWVSGTLLGSRK